MSQEQVLVIPTEKFHKLGYFQGLKALVDDMYIRKLLDPAHTMYKPRDEMEENPNFKQLIPYVIVRYLDDFSKIFCYVRAKSGGEKRLHSRRSLGIGGHINISDKKTSTSNPYNAGMKRELAEEIEIGTSYSNEIIGVLNDDSNKVGQVHLGIVHIIDVTEPKVKPLESSIQSGRFYPVTELLQDLESFENWSRIILETYGAFL